MGSGTNIAAALDLLTKDVFVPSQGDRTGVPNKVVLVTDKGSTTDEDMTPAKVAAAKSAGMDV